MHHLIAELYDGVDWVLVEGFKDSDLQKIEVWRPSTGQPARYLDDDFIVAIATDAPGHISLGTQRPVLDVNQPEQIAQWLIDQGDRFHYNPEIYAKFSISAHH